MPLPIKDVLGILADNLDKRKGALPLDKKRAIGWVDGLNLPFGGETVLYTGQMYQLIPSINMLADRMARFEDSSLTRFFGMGRRMNKLVNLSGFMGRVDPAEQKIYDDILRSIVRLLQQAGVEFGYLYEKDLYSGALLYDQGASKVFSRQARHVYQALKDASVKRVITVDPHTTNMLRTVYPRFIPEFDIEVVSYLAMLAEADLDLGGRLDLDLVIHDSCIYARAEEVLDQPRQLLRDAGVRIHQPEFSRRDTHCCGGPLESLFPAKAHQIASNRIEQLAVCGNQVATMCPICLANLKRAAQPGMEIQDISSWLAGSGEGTKRERVLANIAG